MTCWRQRTHRNKRAERSMAVLGADSQRCWTRSPQRCNTAAAPPSSARCRVWRGRRCYAKRDRRRTRLLRHRCRCTAHLPCASRPVRPQRVPTHCAAGTTARSNTSPPAWPPEGGQAGQPHPSSSAIDGAENRHVKSRNQHHRHLDACPHRRSHRSHCRNSLTCSGSMPNRWGVSCKFAGRPAGGSPASGLPAAAIASRCLV